MAVGFNTYVNVQQSIIANIPLFHADDQNRLKLDPPCQLVNPGRNIKPDGALSAVAISDYVNANPVPGQAPSIPLKNAQDRMNITYVTAQAPKASNLCVFWRTIWDSNVNIIVMLTK